MSADARKRLGKDEIGAMVSRQIALARSGASELSKRRAKALQYYQGEIKDLKAEEGRSKAVSRDLADTMGWMLPGIIRVFTASDHMAIAEPVGHEDISIANEATDAINYVFWKENEGYRIIYNTTWDSLLGGNGILKTWWDDTPRYETSFHSGLSEDQVAHLVMDDAIEVLASTPVDETDPETGIVATAWDLKIRREIAGGQVRIEAVPPEDYGKDSASTTCEDAVFQFHRNFKTRSELIEMGFDRKDVEALSKAARDDDEDQSRRNDLGDDTDQDPATDRIELYECYLKVDIDNDGIAESVRVMYAGTNGVGTVLDWEEWEDETPFNDIPCNPMPHRWEAASIADETMDVQTIKTVLIRQALDNIYATNNPQRFVQGEIENPEELFNPNFGGVVFGKANTSVTPLTIPFVASHAFDAINYQDQVIERRTGVSRTTMALDPEALQNQTATANQNARDAAYSQIELVARNQAELGWKPAFRKVLKLLVKHQDRPRTVRMRGKAVEVDPRHWNADMDITINVGLGTGSRDRDLAMLQTVKADQIGLTERLAQAGFPDKALEMVPRIVETMRQSAEAAGIRSPEQFYPEIGEGDIEAGKQRLKEMQSQPDPKVQEAQAKIQMQAQSDAAKLQMDEQRSNREFELKRMQIDAELVLKRETLAAEIALKRELAFADMQQRRELAMLGAVQAPGSGANVHVGGEPG